MERLSVVEREELWDRYEAGESQRSISRQLGKVLCQRSGLIWFHRVGDVRPSQTSGVRCACLLLIGRRFRGVWPVTSRCALLLMGWGGLLPLCLVKSKSMVAVTSIGRWWRIGHRGGERNVRG